MSAEDDVAFEKTVKILDAYEERYPEGDIDREMLFRLVQSAIDSQVKVSALSKAFHDLVVVERNHAEDSLRWANITIALRDSTIAELKEELKTACLASIDPRKVTYKGVPVQDKIEGLEAQLEDRDTTIERQRERLDYLDPPASD